MLAALSYRTGDRRLAQTFCVAAGDGADSPANLPARLPDHLGELAELVAEGGGRGSASFALSVVAIAKPASEARARSLIWAASRLCDFALRCGLEPEPAVVLSGPVIERFVIVGTASVSKAAQRTVRSNLLSHEGKESPRLGPGSGPARARALPGALQPSRAPGLPSSADNQPTRARRCKASGLIALGAGARLIGADLRLVTGADVYARSGGVVVEVRGLHPRVVPVRREMAERALRSAFVAGPSFIIGGAVPNRRNTTSGLIASLSGGSELDKLSLARLRATWVARCAADIGLATFMAAAGSRLRERTLAFSSQ
jgi:hypothetical protein